MNPYKRTGLLVFCIFGIYASYLTQGIISERFAVKKYGPQEERFQHLESLNGAQALTCFIWAWILLFSFQKTGLVSPSDLPSWNAYWRAGITNSIGPACGMFALKNITYSAQILAKSCKMVPVMLMGSVLHGKVYSMAEYICMSLIGLGVALFARKGSHQASAKLIKPNGLLGYSLCFLNLAFDGYTNAAQDQINHKFPRSSPLHMMCWMNFWTALYYGVYLFLLTSSGPSVVHFLMEHREALWDTALFCLCGAAGQLFIFFTIKSFGSLTNTLVCTTRKFFNILLSVMLNGSALLASQWTAVGMVFAGLVASSLLKGLRGRGAKKRSSAATTTAHVDGAQRTKAE